MNLIAKLLMNSLYGKFGQKQDSSIVEIFNKSTEQGEVEFREFLDTYGESIQTILYLDPEEKLALTVRHSVDTVEHSDDYHGIDVNVAIGGWIPAGGRVYMSYLKNIPQYKLYYSDTDCVVINRPLPEDFVTNQLGYMKLEHTISKAVFLAPKVYSFVTTDGEEITKVKGVSSDQVKNLSFNKMESLLIENSSLELTQDKWYSKINSGTITISEVAYQLKVTSNKRKAVYVNNVFSSTTPYNYDDIITK